MLYYQQRKQREGTRAMPFRKKNIIESGVGIGRN